MHLYDLFVTRTIAIIQSRMDSTRLPGKALVDIAGRPAINQLIRRLRRVQEVAEVVVATTTQRSDDQLADHLLGLGVSVHRGPSADVLGRIAGAAESRECTHVVKVTADCPLLDPSLVSEVIAVSLQTGFDFVSNGMTRSFPDGMDCAVVRQEALIRSALDAKDSLEREHTSLHIRRRPHRYSQQNVHAPNDLYWPELGLTLDTEQDLELLNQVAAAFDADYIPSCAELIQLLRERPDLVTINAQVVRKGDS